MFRKISSLTVAAALALSASGWADPADARQLRPGPGDLTTRTPGPLPDLIVKDLRLNRRCQLLITIANVGKGGVPESGYHRTKGAAVQMYRGAKPWGGIRLFAVDPGKKLKTPGTQVTYKWFPGAANLKLGPGVHPMRAIVDKNNAVKESNERNNSRAERLKCSKGPGNLKAPGGAQTPGLKPAPGGLPQLPGPKKPRPGEDCKGAKPRLAYKGKEPYSGGVRHRLRVVNWKAFCPAMFKPAPNLPPCGANASSSRSWVDIFNRDTGKRIYGFCAFDSPDDLTKLWFAVPAGTAPPKRVYVVITDRQTGTKYGSNSVNIP